MKKKILSLKVKDVLKLQLLYWLAIPLLLYIPIAILSIIFGFSTNHPLVYSIISFFSIVIMYFIVLKDYEIEMKKQIIIDIDLLKALIPMLLAVIGLSIVLSEFDNILRGILPVNSETVKYFKNLIGGGISLKGSILSAAIVAPLSEEILFKSVVLKGLVQNYSIKKSIIISSILFSVVHLNPWQLLGAFVWALFSGWLFIKTNSLILCILGHSLNNSIQYFMIYLFGMSIPGYTTEMDIVQHQPIWFDILGVFILSFSILLLSKIIKSFEFHKNVIE